MRGIYNWNKSNKIAWPQSFIFTARATWPHSATLPHVPPAITNLSNQEEQDRIIAINSSDSNKKRINHWLHSTFNLSSSILLAEMCLQKSSHHQCRENETSIPLKKKFSKWPELQILLWWKVGNNPICKALPLMRFHQTNFLPTLQDHQRQRIWLMLGMSWKIFLPLSSNESRHLGFYWSNVKY